jgi:hypothetical protein
MPARIVLDHPHGQRTSAVIRFGRSVVGSVLVMLGLIATLAIVPAGLVTMGDVISRFDNDPETTIPPEVPVREIEIAFIASTVIAWVGLRHGRRLVRGRRSMVLFLRRFGYRGSMEAVTFAVVRTIGDSWRLVTLDDEAIAPVGVAPVSRFVFGAGTRLSRVALGLGRFIIGSFRWTVTAAVVVLGLQLAQIQLNSNWSRAMRDGTLDAYLGIVTSLLEGRIPVAFFAPTLTGAFAVLATTVAVGLIGLFAVMGALLLALPLSPLLIAASSSAEALRKAEAAKTGAIRHLKDVDKVVADIAEQGRQTFASRLVVLRVATAVWRESVTTLARVTSASIIDISEPTEHLLWELDTLDRLCANRSIVIGEQASVERWSQDVGVASGDTALGARFAARLDGRQVLAYTTDRAGMRRFARALHGMLLDIGDGPS